MGDEVPNGVGVAHDEALEAPRVAQHLGEQPAAARRRNPVEVHVGGHHVAGAGVDRRLERREVHVPELGVGEVDLVVVAPTERGAVAGEVLRTGDDAVRRTQLVALEAAHLGDGHGGAEVRVFAGALDDPTPTWIAGDVDHRRERPMDADRTRLTGGDRLATLDRLGIPRRRHRDRHRKDRAQPVDDVETEQHRDAETVAFDREPLEAVDLGRIGDEQQRTRTALPQRRLDHPRLLVGVEVERRGRHPPASGSRSTG